MEKNLTELKKQVQDFCEARNWDQYHNIKDLAIGVSTEAGELLDIFRFYNEEQCANLLKDEKKKVEIEDEMSDVLFFILRMAQMNDINLSEALEKKIKKNGEKYPVDKAYGSNIKYSDL